MEGWYELLEDLEAWIIPPSDDVESDWDDVC